MRSLIVLVSRLTPRVLKSWVHKSRILDRIARKSFSFFSSLDGRTAVIEKGPMNGILLALGEHISHAHITGQYEIETQKVIDRLVRPGFVCYDLGASIGYLSLLMAKKARQVYAFEPAPHAAAEIRRQASANGFQNITIVPAPVSDRKRTVLFSLTDVAYGSCIVEGKTKWPTLELTAITLDEFVLSNSFPDFIKIDVEGEEGKVLQGAKSILEKRKTLFCCELHSAGAAKEVHDVLSMHGYQMWTLTGEPFSISSPIVAGLVQVVAAPG